jgi:hypothetical protein
VIEYGSSPSFESPPFARLGLHSVARHVRHLGRTQRTLYLGMTRPDILIPLTAAAAIAAYGFYLRLI